MTALLLAALLTAPANAAPTAPGEDASMQATHVEGMVTVNGGPLLEGDPLHPGDNVQTTPGARLEVTLGTGSVLRLGESSRMTLGATPPNRAFSVRLFLGNLWTKVHKLTASQTFQLETENAVAGVRGTEFRVEVAPCKEDLLRVYEGAVEVKAHDGKWSHRVEPGHELRFARERATPRAFEAASEGEKEHKLMKWVREKPVKEGTDHLHRLERHEEPEPHERHKHR